MDFDFLDLASLVELDLTQISGISENGSGLAVVAESAGPGFAVLVVVVAVVVAAAAAVLVVVVVVAAAVLVVAVVAALVVADSVQAAAATHFEFAAESALSGFVAAESDSVVGSELLLLCVVCFLFLAGFVLVSGILCCHFCSLPSRMFRIRRPTSSPTRLLTRMS